MIVNDTAVITCFFNFTGYITPQRNLRRWKRYMDAYGVPNYGVEIYLRGSEPISKGWEGWRQIPAIRELHCVFQKEAALNVCVRHVPDCYTKIVVADCDCFFENPEWLSQTSAVLNVVNACSPYSQAIWTDHTGKEEMQRSSLGLDPAGLIPAWRSHPGFAIALRRDFWAKGGPNGLFPFYVVGNGDTCLGVALANLEPKHNTFTKVPKMYPIFLEWYDRVRKWSNGLSFVDGRIIHEFHGTRKNRQYVERLDWIAELDPKHHLKFNDDGLLEWLPNASGDMVAKVADYFVSRKEDEIF